MITLMVITDGRRDCIDQAVNSAEVNLDGPVTAKFIYDDSGDPDNVAWLTERFPEFEVISHPAGRQGFGGAVRAAWAHALSIDNAFVFHLEDDFTFNRPVDLQSMAEVLVSRPDLVQLALRRQPWNDLERAAGGIVEQHPDAYTDRVDEFGREWLEHRLFFTTNPSLYRRALCARVWPAGANSEGRFTHQLLATSAARFGFWGSRTSGEAVTHIGHQRAGIGY